ncbi:CHAD domain-containing protein [Rhodopila sp.]|uniref:CHAD domain-containing protein n=1 Tax=Rhodopila sp. TaxID=2480087 RepID=UPI003D0DFBBA
MELELQADPDTVAGMSRLKALAREGRPRSQVFKVVWHDSPDQTLLSQGLILAEQRGRWRLERVLPAAETWLPGQPPPVLQESQEPTALTAGLPVRLAPVAAFQGRRTVSEHRIEEAPVTLLIECGVLRSVTAEQAVARIQLSGADHAVHAAALVIANAAAVWVPRASLAARAIALASGGVPVPRRLGPPVLPGVGMTVAAALTHILGHLTDVILHHAPVAAQSDAKDVPDANRVEAVHQMRVAVRRALSAISVFRGALPDGALDRVHDGLKTLGATLGFTRDWDVFVGETAPMIAKALPPDKKLDRLIAAAVRRRHDHRAALAHHLQSPAFRVLGIELAWFALHFWPASADVSPDGPDQDRLDQVPAERSLVADFAPGVLQHRWKKLTSVGKQIETLDIPALHELRLRAKRARYAAEMFAGLDNGRAAHRFIRRLSVLQQRLGLLNDAAVAAQLLDELGGSAGRHGYAVGIVVGFTASRAGKLRPQIIRAFEKFRRQPIYWT